MERRGFEPLTSAVRGNRCEIEIRGGWISPRHLFPLSLGRARLGRPRRGKPGYGHLPLAMRAQGIAVPLPRGRLGRPPGGRSLSVRSPRCHDGKMGRRDNPAWTVVLPSGVVAELEHDPAADDFPWYGVTVRRGPCWNEVADDFSRELGLLDAGALDAWEELWRGLRDRGLRFILPGGGEGKFFALHVDGNTARLRYVEE